MEGRADSQSAVGLQRSALTALDLSLAMVVVVVEIRGLAVAAHSPEVEAPLAGMVKTRAVGALVRVEEEQGSPAGA